MMSNKLLGISAAYAAMRCPSVRYGALLYVGHFQAKQDFYPLPQLLWCSVRHNDPEWIYCLASKDDSFLVRFFNFSVCPCGGLSWLHVSFLLHVKYTALYRIVSYRIVSDFPSTVSGHSHSLTASSRTFIRHGLPSERRQFVSLWCRLDSACLPFAFTLIRQSRQRLR